MSETIKTRRAFTLQEKIEYIILLKFRFVIFEFYFFEIYLLLLTNYLKIFKLQILKLKILKWIKISLEIKGPSQYLYQVNYLILIYLYKKIFFFQICKAGGN